MNHSVRAAQYAALAKQNLPPEEVARRLGVKTRTARLYMRKHQMWDHPPVIPQDKWAWAERALTEGVPISWVAETVDIPVSTLSSRWRELHGPGARDFSKVWPGILHSPRLYELHAEFAPKS